MRLHPATAENLPQRAVATSVPRLTAAFAFGLALLSGCAGFTEYREGRSKLEQGQYEDGLAKLREASRRAPDNLEYRRSLTTRTESVLNELARSASVAAEASDWDRAQQIYEQMLRIEPGNVRATAGLERLAMTRRHAAMLSSAQTLAAAGDTRGAQETLAAIIRENPADRRAQSLMRQWAAQTRLQSGALDGTSPKLKTAYRKAVSLAFREASLTQVFDSLKLASGINFLFDKDVRTDSRLTLVVSGKPLEDVIRVILAGQRLSLRVLDEDTLLVYPNTPEKARDYQEMVIRTFYLGNAEAAKVVNLARTVLKVRDVYIDEKLNLLVMRDTPEQMRLVERVLANLDVAEPEVMLELEVLEISRNRLREIGIRIPDSVSASVTGTATPGVFTSAEWRNRNSGLLSYALANPIASANFKQSDGDVKLLSNPRIRVRNKQTAKVLVGERVPVITTTVTANVGTSESVSYLDVGLKLELEPTVALDDDVSMKVALEVSSITGTVTRSSGLQAYRVGTRNASTMLRVRDGETQILAGLIQSEDRRAASGIPFLSDAPVLGRLFSNTQDTESNSEVVLLITPRVVRNVLIPGPERIEILGGTDAAQGAGPIQLGPVQGGVPILPQPVVRPQAPVQQGFTAAPPSFSGPSMDPPSFSPNISAPVQPASGVPAYVPGQAPVTPGSSQPGVNSVPASGLSR